jgi:hypothetical protein
MVQAGNQHSASDSELVGDERVGGGSDLSESGSEHEG